jgi:hypothetical protein
VSFPTIRWAFNGRWLSGERDLKLDPGHWRLEIFDGTRTTRAIEFYVAAPDQSDQAREAAEQKATGSSS